MKLQNLKKSLVLIVVAVVLVCAFLFMGFSPANFADTELANEQNIATIEECTNAAKVWLSQNYNDGTEIGDIIPIIEGDDISAYCVNFQLNNMPNGYVVVNTNKNSGECIKEFGLSGEGIYETLVDNYNANGYGNLNGKREKKIFSTGLFEYAIPTDNNTCYTSNNEKLSLNFIKELSHKINSLRLSYDTELTEKIEMNEGFYNGTALGTSGFKYAYLTGIDNFIPSVMHELRPSSSYSQSMRVNLGNCSVTAATNLVSYYAEKRGFSNLLINNKRQATYNNIVDISGFKSYLPSSLDYDQEGLNLIQINNAISKYVKSKGYKYSSDTYWFNLWSDWRRDINNGYPVYTSIQGLSFAKNEWIKVGHAVIAVGYREYEANNAKYLRVLDGWNRTSDRYLYFNSNYFTSKNGIAMKVKV